MVIYIEKLAVTAKIGVHAFEKALAQRLFISCRLSYNAEKAVVTDNVSDALDYMALAEHIKTFCENNTYQLLESLIAALAQSFFSFSEIESVDLHISKPQALLGCQDVGVAFFCKRE